MSAAPNPNIDVFAADVARNGGYLYTTNAQPSSRMANRRLTEATLALANLQGKRFLDIGCGDGTYTRELFDLARPKQVHGIDPAASAIESANRQTGNRSMCFTVGSAYELPFASGSYDWAYLRGVLHHLDRPRDALREALRVARRILVIEPNGYNPVLKVLEKTSRYHKDHDEKSYFPFRLREWVHASGGQIEASSFAGLVPMFCPDWMARTCKALEPLVERVPLVRAVGCAVYVFVAAAPSAVLTEAA